MAAVWLIACGPSRAQNLTGAQATQIAVTFCQNIGKPVSDPGVTQFPAPNRYSTQQATFWQNRWQIKFADKVEVEVVDATGTVSRYVNNDLLRQLAAANQPSGNPMSQTTAFLRAGQILTAAGPMDSLASATALLSRLTEGNTTADATWNVTLGRQYQGIPYRNQSVNIILQAETGDLLGLSLVFPSPPPSNGPAQVTSTQAGTIAGNLLTNAGLTTAVFQSSKQMIVQPNTFWQAGGNTTPQTGVARIVWDCFYTLDGRTCEVWVDAETGNVIGGEIYGIARSKRRTVTLPEHPVSPAPVKKTPTPKKTKKAKAVRS